MYRAKQFLRYKNKITKTTHYNVLYMLPAI